MKPGMLIGMKHGTSTLSNRISYDGSPSGKCASDRYSVPIGVNAGTLRRLYRNMEGSLVWLHMKEPFRWPYNILCGDNSDNDLDSDEYLSIEDTIAVTADILSKGIMSIRIAHDMAVSPPTVHNWKCGKCRAPKELKTYLNNLK